MPTRPEYQDPSRFPCGVVGCGARAAGWVHPSLAGAVGIESDVEAEAERIYLCSEHLEPVREGS